MNRPTKIQTTVDFDSIPQNAQAQIRAKAFPLLRSALAELSHLVSEHTADKIESSTILHHVDQARRKMYEADLFIQDVQSMVSQYQEYIQQEQLQSQQQSADITEEFSAQTEKLKSAVAAATAATARSTKGEPENDTQS